MSVDILVTRRAGDFHAVLADNPGVWESGKTQVEAIGKLVISAGDILGITVHAKYAAGKTKK